eukprot:CAMPEP_0197081762 /NCGR_PEP_ID=MMETSP1384-20130603/214799_1 /TAXON_ID=29189 /ORGANISM="Ammonia sp." /LENGTH=362 /DNA_ID=CAMNT_0042520661 /DNA_START=13 /DNA_END=1101 /DNA_ORIENTATION=+
MSNLLFPFAVTILIGVITFIGLDYYIFRLSEHVSINLLHSNSSQRASSECHSNFYHKKRLDRNCSYNVYLIQIGRMLQTQLNESHIKALSDIIEVDILWTEHPSPRKSIGSRQRKEWFRAAYADFSEFDMYSASGRNQPLCADEHADPIDVFQFLQDDMNKTNDPTLSGVSFYDAMPINEHEFDRKAKRKYKHIHDEYYPPKLLSYTLSVAATGYAPSLELRIAEICNEYQQEEVKHESLNRNQRYLLWAGEMYWFYDCKYRRYVLVMDNASGHWKPNFRAIPSYFEWILYQTVFHGYNTDGETYYKPVIFVERDDLPWNETKSDMFPVLGDIERWKWIRHAMKKKKLILGMEKMNGEEIGY